MRRECGTCQLCCKLLPVPPLDKGAGERCKHQKVGKGCAVYHTRAMPPECGLWNCRWLVNDDAGDLSRPDRSHYVIDLMPDFVTASWDDKVEHIQVVQIWCDPDFPDAWREPNLRAWMLRRAEDGIACIVRFDSRRAITVFAPPLSTEGHWFEIADNANRAGHDFSEITAALGPVRMVLDNEE